MKTFAPLREILLDFRGACLQSLLHRFWPGEQLSGGLALGGGWHDLHALRQRRHGNRLGHLGLPRFQRGI
jgi:hypothetical protein